MIENMKRRLATAGIVAFMMLGSLGAPLLVSAESPVDPSNFGYKKIGQYFGQANEANFSNLQVGVYRDPRELARNIINIVLGFLGIIAVVIVLFAGFQWMTAGGEEEKVKEAQQRLIQGAIGLVLIVAAWMIAYYVIDQVVGAVQGRG
ncbi:MAG: pilin [Candidatus Uhrbacteria bacterium]|nr:pilin [Candidatus Uhrbacteria bacterium]